MPGMIRSHRDLHVYQEALAAAMHVYEASKSFPPAERFSLTAQVRDSSRSVCANIAEAWRKRRYPKSFVSKLSDADAEAAETLVWLDFTSHFGYLSDVLYKELADQYDHICRQLTLMMAEPQKWSPGAEPGER